MQSKSDNIYMLEALKEAKKALKQEEVPIGAILVNNKTGNIAARAHNSTIQNHDPTCHAEINAIRAVCEIEKTQRIPDYDLYVTLEPCSMCAAAISFARINKLVFGVSDEKGGAVINGPRFFEQKTCHHKPKTITNVNLQECGKILKQFFQNKRKEKQNKN
jgi:tRNA(Arg) A34 adenosine deaminase TadA